MKPLHGVIGGLGAFEIHPDGSFKLIRSQQNLSPVTFTLTTAGKAFLKGCKFSDLAVTAQEVTFRDNLEANRVTLAASDTSSSNPLMTISQGQKYKVHDFTLLSGQVENQGTLATTSLKLGTRGAFRNQTSGELKGLQMLDLTGEGKLWNAGCLTGGRLLRSSMNTLENTGTINATALQVLNGHWINGETGKVLAREKAFLTLARLMNSGVFRAPVLSLRIRDKGINHGRLEGETLCLRINQTFRNEGENAILYARDFMGLSGPGSLINKSKESRNKRPKTFPLQAGIFSEGDILFEKDLGSLVNEGDFIARYAIEGKIGKLENSGTLRGRIFLLEGLAQGLFNREQGQLLGKKEVQINTVGSFHNEGVAGTLKGSLTLVAQGVTNKGLLQTPGGTLNVRSEHLANSGKIRGHSLFLSSIIRALENDGVIRSEEGELILFSTKDFKNKGSLKAKKAAITLQVPAFHNLGRLFTPQALHSRFCQELINDGSFSIGSFGQMPKRTSLVNGEKGIFKLTHPSKNPLHLSKLINAGSFECPDLDLVIEDHGENRGTLRGNHLALILGGIFINEGPFGRLRTHSLTLKGPGSFINKSQTLLHQGANPLSFQAGVFSENGIVFEGFGSLVNEGDFITPQPIEGKIGKFENRGYLSGERLSLTGLEEGFFNREKGQLLGENAVQINAAGSFRNEGTAGAVKGPWHLIAAQVVNKGRLEALGGRLTIQSERLTNTGQIWGHSLFLSSIIHALSNKGILRSEEGDLILSSTKAFENEGSVEAKKDAITLQVPAFHNLGRFLTPQALHTQATTLINSSQMSIGVLGQRPNLENFVNGKEAFFHHADPLTDPLSLALFVNEGTFQIPSLDLHIRDEAENKGVLRASRLTLTLDGVFRNEGPNGMLRTGFLTLKGPGLLINESQSPRHEASESAAFQAGIFSENGIIFESLGGLLNKGDFLTLQALEGSIGQLENQGYLRGKKLSFTGLDQGLLNQEHGQLLSETDLQINMAGTLQNNGVLSAEDGSCSLIAGTFTNKGHAQAPKGKIQVEGDRLFNLGKIVGLREILLKTQNDLINEGTMGALQGPLTLVAHRLFNKGTVQSEEGPLHLSSTKDFENKGTLATKKASITLQMPGFRNTGRLITPKELNAASIMTLTNNGFLSIGTIGHMPNLKNIINGEGATFHHATSLRETLHLLTLLNRGIIQFPTLDLHIQESAENHGTLKAETLSVTAQNWNNAGGTLIGRQETLLHIKNAFSNKDGIVGSEGPLQLRFDAITSGGMAGTLQGKSLALSGSNTLVLKDGTLLGTDYIDLQSPKKVSLPGITLKTSLLLLSTRDFSLEPFIKPQTKIKRFLLHKPRGLSLNFIWPFQIAGSFEIWEEGSLSREDLLTKTAAENFESLAARFTLNTLSETTLSFLSTLTAGGVVLATPHSVLQVGTEGAPASARVDSIGPFSFLGAALDLQKGGLASQGKMHLWFKNGHLGRTLKARTSYPFTYPSGRTGTFFYTKEESNGSFLYAKEGLNGFCNHLYAELFPINSNGPIDLTAQKRLHLCSSSLSTQGSLTVRTPDLHLNRKVAVYNGHVPEADGNVQALIHHDRASEIVSKGPLTFIGLQHGLNEGSHIQPLSTLSGADKIQYKDLVDQVLAKRYLHTIIEYNMYTNYDKHLREVVVDPSLQESHQYQDVYYSPVYHYGAGTQMGFWFRRYHHVIPQYERYKNNKTLKATLAAPEIKLHEPHLDLRNALVRGGTIDLTCETLTLPVQAAITFQYEPFEPVQPLLNFARLTQLHVEEPENPVARFNLPAFLRDPEPVLPPLTVISPEGLSPARENLPRLLAPVLEIDALRQALLKQFGSPWINPRDPYVEVLYKQMLEEGQRALATWQARQGSSQALVKMGPQTAQALSLEKPALFYQEVTHEDGKPVYVPTLVWPRSYEALRPKTGLSGVNILLNAWSVTGAVHAQEQLAILSPDLKPVLMLEDPQNLAQALTALPAEKRRELFLQGTFKGKKTLVASLQNLRASSRVERQRTPTGFQDRLHQTVIEGEERLDFFAGGNYRDDSILAQSSQGNIAFQIGGHKESRALALQSHSETSGTCPGASEWTFEAETTQTTPVPSTYHANGGIQESVGGHNLSEAPHISAQRYDSQAGEDNILLPVMQTTHSHCQTRTEDNTGWGTRTKTNNSASFTQKAQVATIETEEQAHIYSDMGNVSLTGTHVTASLLALGAPHGTVEISPAPNIQESTFQGSSTGSLAISQTIDAEKHVTHTYPQLPEKTVIDAPQVVLDVPETLRPLLPPQVIGTALLPLPAPTDPLPAVLEREAALSGSLSPARLLEASSLRALMSASRAPQGIFTPTSSIASQLLSPHRPFTTQEERALATLRNLILAEGSRLTFQFHQDQHLHHHEEHTSLNPRFCALMGLAATLATGGLLGTAALAQTSFITSMASATGISAATLSAAAMAGISTMGGQTLASLIGHEGDLGAALKDLGSPQFLKSLVANMASAGLLKEVQLGRFGKALTFVDKPQTFLEHGQKALTQAVVQTGVHAALQGSSLENALENIGRGTAASTLGSMGANALHDLLPQIGFLPHKLGHGVLGSVMGGLLSQDPETGIKTGFISGLTAETLAEGAHGLGLSKELAGSIGEFSGPLTVFFTQGENGDILTASVISHNAIENNFLYEPQNLDDFKRLREELEERQKTFRDFWNAYDAMDALTDVARDSLAVLPTTPQREFFKVALGRDLIESADTLVRPIEHRLGMSRAETYLYTALPMLGLSTYNTGQALRMLVARSSVPKGLSEPIGIAADKLLMGEYRAVKGHHVHAKKAFEGHVNYDPQKGFSMSEEFMDILGVRHADISIAQRRFFTELAKSGRPNTLKEHTYIAVESLVEVGVDRPLARSIVAKSLEDLRKKGVRNPTNIPWNNKKNKE